MLTYQVSLKESICEKNFPITCINTDVAFRQLFSYYQLPHISILQKMYFKVLQLLLTAGFVIC